MCLDEEQDGGCGLAFLSSSTSFLSPQYVRQCCEVAHRAHLGAKTINSRLVVHISVCAACVCVCGLSAERRENKTYWEQL